MKKKPVLPESMDRWTRNARLYETLKGMGLFVSPVPEKDDPTRINHILVSTDLPFAGEVAEDAAKASAATKRAGVAHTEGHNVVDFPLPNAGN